LVYGDVQHLETGLTEKIRKAEDMVTYALKQRNTCPLKFLKANFHLQENWKPEQMSDLKKNLDIYYNIEDYVKSKESTVKHCTINVINAMKAHVKSFETFRKEAITFDSLDMNFYEDFVKYLTYDIFQLRRKEVIKGLKVNSVGKTIKHLKSFLKDRMRKKIIPFMDLGAYKVMEEEVDAVYLSCSELSLIYHLDLSAKRNLEEYRHPPALYQVAALPTSAVAWLWRHFLWQPMLWQTIAESLMHCHNTAISCWSGSLYQAGQWQYRIAFAGKIAVLYCR